MFDNYNLPKEKEEELKIRRLFEEFLKFSKQKQINEPKSFGAFSSYNDDDELY